MSKSNLFIVGVPKAGTTTLCDYLNQHSDIFLPKIKEPHFFSKLTPQKYTEVVSDEKIYNNLYKNKTEQYKCDGSTSYFFFSKISSPSIFKYNLNSKIIMILRNPIDRSYSEYQMNVKLNDVTSSRGLINFFKTCTDARNVYFGNSFKIS